MNTHQLNAGFTFVELIMVLVVGAVLAAVAASRWNATDATAPYQGELLARNIRHLQSLAMAWSQTLQLTPTSGGYSVSCATAGAAPCNVSPVIDPATGSPFSLALSYGVTLSGPALNIDSLGRPVSVPGGALLTTNQVYAINAGTQTWSVTVKPITGFVVVSTP